jgi:peptide/nickel transport system permease protein
MALAVLSLGADWLPLPSPDEQDLNNMLAGPSMTHWMGADSLGRDILARMVHGLRLTFFVSFASVGLALVIGTVLGVSAGHVGGWYDRVLGLCLNVLLAFPPLVLIVALVAYPGNMMSKIIVALTVVFVPSITRIARAATLRFSRLDFVAAARVAGLSDGRIIARELMPNVLPVLLSYAFLLLGIGALAEAGLSYLGLGMPPSVPTLGGMMAAEQGRLLDAPHAVFFPGLVLFLTIFAINVVGERFNAHSEGARR